MSFLTSTAGRAAAVTAALAAAGVFGMTGPATGASRDSDHDGMPNRWEVAHHLDAHRANARGNPDRDRLSNLAEFRHHTNPRDADTDNDGTEDGNENAGRIQSFDANSGRLVITLFGGDTLSGQVNDQTEIECDNENENEANDQNDDNDRLARHGDDNSGPGSENSGPGGDDENGTCTTADLTAGRVVDEAELHTEGGAAVFEEVELGD